MLGSRATIARVREGALAADHRERLIGDLQVLVGGHDQHGHGGVVRRDGPGAAGAAPLRLGLRGDAEAFDALAAAGLDAVAVLPDPGG
jgi:hypothetical protein